MVEIAAASGRIALEELCEDGSVCRARTARGVRVGTTSTVLAAASGRPPNDPWVIAVTAALARERKWRAWGSGWGRSHSLEIKVGQGTMYHVTAIANRASILKWGLDWDHMGDSPGVAGSRTPEAPGIWLNDDAKDDFFVDMARHALETWEVDVTGLWLELRPHEWWFTSSRISPDRLRLVPSAHAATA